MSEFSFVYEERTRNLVVTKLDNRILARGDVIAIKWPSGVVSQHRVEITTQESGYDTVRVARIFVEHNGALLDCLLMPGMSAKFIKKVSYNDTSNA